MSANLEALVGHLFVVGGRAISSASPGGMAMAAPRRAARGRDADTLFGLFSLNPDQRQPASFYEQMATALTDQYFATTGSLTSALREAIGTVNASLRAAQPAGSSPTVGLACAILREQELIIALVGPARCFVVHEGTVERMPGDEEVAEGMHPLGTDGDPDIRLYWREIQANDFVILADLSLNRANDMTIRQAVADGEVDGALNALRAAAGEFGSAEVIKFVSPDDQPAPAPAASAAPAPAPQRAASHTAAMEEIAISLEHLPPARRVGRSVALGMARAVSGLQTLVRKMLPDLGAENPLEERFQMSFTTQVAVAIAVAVVVALVTIVVYGWRGQTSQYAQLIGEAQKEADQARAGGNDQAAARPHWETALFLLNRAAEIRAAGPEITRLKTEAITALDSYDHATRVKPVLLREYEPGAALKGPIVQGVNLYVVDTAKDILYREDLDQNGTKLINSAPQIVARQGDVLNDQLVGGLIDLIWMEDGGAPQKNVLAVLSRNGLLITYSPSFAASAEGLPGFEAWQDPRAIAIYNRDLYILDAGANEIWRYQAGPDSYSSLPQRYFTDFVPSLADAIDMKIDSNGNVYVLHASGKIEKFFFGRQQPFDLVGLPQPIARPTALTLSLNLVDRVFYISDPGGGRLYSTALNGAFLANYKDSENTLFTTLTGVFSQDLPAMIYISAGNRLYAFPRPQ